MKKTYPLYLSVRLNKTNCSYVNIILYLKYFYKPRTVDVGGHDAINNVFVSIVKINF